ncbi:uncharacterized protein LOC119192537 [Manduca sexta]|nr:uncharacterized protein LOC119192537 [Manduca sexta]
MYHGMSFSLPAELCVAIYCLEVIFNAVLIYGTHKRSTPHIRVFYYFAIATTIAPMLMTILDYTNYSHIGLVLEMALLSLSSLFLNLYLITLVRSLLRKLDMEGPNLYDNPLHQIVTGEAKVEHNGIYNNTTVEPVDV